MDLRELEEFWPYEKTLAWLRSDPRERRDQSAEWPRVSLPTQELLNRVRAAQRDSLIRLTISPEYLTRARPAKEGSEDRPEMAVHLPRHPARVAREFLFGVIRIVHISGIGSYSVEFIQAIRRPDDRALAITLQWLSDSAATERTPPQPFRAALAQFEFEELEVLTRVMGPVLGAFVAAFDVYPRAIAFPRIQSSVMALLEREPVEITDDWTYRLLVSAATLIDRFEQRRG